MSPWVAGRPTCVSVRAREGTASATVILKQRFFVARHLVLHHRHHSSSVALVDICPLNNVVPFIIALIYTGLALRATAFAPTHRTANQDARPARVQMTAAVADLRHSNRSPACSVFWTTRVALCLPHGQCMSCVTLLPNRTLIHFSLR